MIKLFGDSFSNYYLPKNKNLHWWSILCDKLDTPLINYAEGGYTNKDILSSLIMNISEFKQNEIIIVNTTAPNRMNLSPGNPEILFHDANHVWNPKSKIDRQLDKFELKIARDYMDNIFLPFETENPSFINEIHTLLNFLQTNVSKIIIWNWDIFLDLPQFNINNSDKHLNILGHQHVSNVLLNTISDTSNKITFLSDRDFDKKSII